MRPSFRNLTVTLFLTLIVLSVLPAVDEAQGAEQPREILFMDGDEAYYLYFEGTGMSWPPDPSHYGKQFTGWSLDGEVVDLEELDLGSLGRVTIVYATYSDVDTYDRPEIRAILAVLITFIVLYIVYIAIRRY